MSAVVASLTLRQLLSRRRTILLLLLGAVLVLVAVAYRLGGPLELAAARWTSGLLNALGLAVLVPLVALIFGTGAMGAELEEGTAVHLLTKPVARWRIGIVKLVVAAVCAAVLSAVPIFVAGLIAGGDLALALAFTVGAAAGATVYVALFMALSLITDRAFVIGLAYVLVWEGLLAGLFPGTRTFSVHQQSLAIADALTGAFGGPQRVVDAPLSLATALIAAIAIALVATAVALRRLRGLQIAGETA